MATSIAFPVVGASSEHITTFDLAEMSFALIDFARALLSIRTSSLGTR